ncbi:MAG: hypothetical protein VKO21_06735 [Candidatus Sericytochromatia bacterium]|nr:hypothetical protein [Candidatus Sericytochromatia bacterium]
MNDREEGKGKDKGPSPLERLKALAGRFPLPKVDIGILAGALMIAGLSAGASVLGVRVFMPEHQVQMAPPGQEVQAARRLNPFGLQGFTIGPNVPTTFVTHLSDPKVAEDAFVHPQAAVLGAVTVGREVLVAPQASIRGDEGQGILLATGSAVLDGAVITGRPTEQRGLFVERHTVRVDFVRYSVRVGERSTVSAHAVLRGPVALGDDVWVGPHAVVDDALVGKGAVLEARCVVQGGVRIGEGRIVPAGQVVRTQAEADALPAVTAGYALRDEARRASEVNRSLALAYGALYPRSGLPEVSHGGHSGGHHAGPPSGTTLAEPGAPEHEPVGSHREEGAALAPPPTDPVPARREAVHREGGETPREDPHHP